MSNKRNRISLKNGNTLTYKNNRWYYNNKPFGDWTLNKYKFVDSDGYTKKLTKDGGLAVQDVDKKGNSITPSYIGGTTKEAREKYWNQAPIMRHATDSIAEVYGINPSLLRDRLNKEGYTDKMIRLNNNSLNDTPDEKEINRNYANYNQLNRFSGLHDGTSLYGLDDVHTYIQQGDVVPIDVNYFDTTFTNEKGRQTNAATGETTKDNFSLVAATLKYMRDKVAKDFPNSSRIFLDEAAGIYYNRGAAGGKKYIQNKKK